MSNTYTAGCLAKMAGVSSRTIRFYDKEGILKPVAYTQSGYRLYDAQSLLQLQKIKMLQTAGFSLEDIKRILWNQKEEKIEDILWEQKLIMLQKKYQIQQMIQLLDEALFVCNINSDEEKLVEAVSDVFNVSGKEAEFDYRYQFYEKYSINQQGWHPWVFEQLELFQGATVLDVGCGNGLLWIKNWTKIPKGVTVTLVDKLSSGIESFKKFYYENRKFLQPEIKFKFIYQNVEDSFCIEKKYDRVITNHFWEFIDRKQDLMKKIVQSLVEGGFMITTFSASFFIESVLNFIQDYITIPGIANKILINKKDREDTVELLKTEFKIVESKEKVSEILIENERILLTFVENYVGGKLVNTVTEKRKIEQFLKEQGKVEWKNCTPMYICRK